MTKRHLFLAGLAALLLTITAFTAVIPAAATSKKAATPVATPTITPTQILPGVSRVSKLRVHDSPSTAGATLFTLSRNQHISILGVSPNKRWLKIQTDYVKTGWVSIFYIRITKGRLKNLAVLTQ
jgi:hypothetical protein